MDQHSPLRRVWPLLAALAGLSATSSAALAQRAPPPRWTFGVDVGAMLPAWLYNERVTAARDTLSFSTDYSERIHTAPLVRAVLRYKPHSEFGGFLSAQFATGETAARFSGGLAAPETITRHVDIWTFAAGMSVQVSEWAGGDGGLEYLFGPVLTRHTLDLSNGHRDAFAYGLGVPDTLPLHWQSRTWTGWGLSIGGSARFPVGRDLGVRVSVHNLILPVATGEMSSQEQDDVLRLSGRLALFSYRAYTAHYPSIRVGLEYVLSRVPPRVETLVSLPPPARQVEASAETRAARAMLARGDTVAAITALRRRVQEQPTDASAWRDLALLLAVDAEGSPIVRVQAWEALQRAVTLNPDDEELLVAYGRIRSLLQRGRVEVAAPAPPFSVSDVDVQADAAGGLYLAWSVSGLPRTEDGRVRYLVRVEVVDDAGERVPLRLADAPPEDAAAQIELEREGGAGPAFERLGLRLSRAQPGPYTVRIRVTNPASGQSVTRVAGFEIR